MAKIGFPKGSGKRLKVREKSVKSQGILKWILSGNPGFSTTASNRTSGRKVELPEPRSFLAEFLVFFNGLAAIFGVFFADGR